MGGHQAQECSTTVSSSNCSRHSIRLLRLRCPVYPGMRNSRPLLSNLFVKKISKIYRCWIVWGKKIRVVIVPSILAFIFLGPSTYLCCFLANFDSLLLAVWVTAGVAPMHVGPGLNVYPIWSDALGVVGLALSMIVNALVTGLILFKLFKVFREVKAASNEQILRVTGAGSTLRAIIFVLIESGMALLSIQLVRLVTATAFTATNLDNVYSLITRVHEMFTVIISSNISTCLFY